ncbi:MAG: MBL fold metallo-hydrolase [Oscillospiraceae bacterium]|nr:MBL fold metallo-hydrolase [Oscillospiraceae bacterium]
MRTRKLQIAALLLTLTMLLTACASGAKKAPGDSASAATLDAHFFDAGKADAILLTTADSAVLIDAGEKGFGKTILAYLEEQGVEKLDCLIVTHFDKDHVGGAAKVINSVAVGTVLQSNSPKDSDEYEKYVKALEKSDIEPVTVRETLTFTLDGVTYTVDPPAQESYADDPSNNSSLIVSVVNGADSFLFTGDAQTARLAEFLSGDVSACDVLKLPHHGQDEPLLDALLDATSPAYAVITSSDDEPESDAVVAALERAGATVLLTRSGAVTLRSGGDGVQLLAE